METTESNISLKGKIIKNIDLKRFCQILKDKNIDFKVSVKYKDEIGETTKTCENDVNYIIDEKFNNLRIEEIYIYSNDIYMQLYNDYGYIKITAKDEIINNYLQTNIKEWLSSLKKVKRVDNDSIFRLLLPMTAFIIFILAYLIFGTISSLIKNQMPKTIDYIIDMIFAVIVTFSFCFYNAGLVETETDIGINKYKKFRNIAKWIFTSIILPIILSILF